MGINKETKSFWQKGIVAFLVIAASILFFIFVYKFGTILRALQKVISVLEPIIFGLVISYLLNPLVDFFNKRVFPKLCRKKNKEFKLTPALNMLSVCLSLLFFIIIIAGIIVLIIPQFIESFSNVVETLPDQIDSLIGWGEKVLKENNSLESAFETVLNYEKKWLKDDVSTYINAAAEYFASGVMGVLTFLKNFAIGFIVAIYLLYNKTRFGNKTRKLMFATFKEQTVKSILSGLHKSNQVFSGFIYAKLLDSLIIGVLCFIGISIMRIPYTMLVAVIIAVTNVIPVFGPYIGAIPCAALILMTNPLKGLYFIIFIILLQTFDGNLLGPKILGDKTGLETFWVIFAIVVGGGLFGVLGLVIGVPLFAVVYYFVSLTINNRLKKKNLSTDSADYSAEKLVHLIKEESKSEDA
ncbi:MAG: AI-2E family transporter [Clostridia bacterium]|nr:AI-2E family transporter [Clostridia bacterium]